MAISDDRETDAGRAAILVAMTAEARAALGNRTCIRMTTFPFRIGREARNPLTRVVTKIERRLGTTVQLNDLYLIDASDGVQISRAHCVIECEQGEFCLADSGSRHGSTVVESRSEERPAAIATSQVGPLGSWRTALRDGDVIVMGHIGSPYVFRFQVEPCAVSPAK
jgi:pSer/pThr/pTyr-binding forkhead associated (FHA) protein